MSAGDPILAADYAGIRRGTIDGILCRLRQSVAQSIPNNASTAVTFDVEDFDPFNLHSTTVNTTRITPTQAGYYEVRGGVSMALMSAVTAVWDVAIGKTGVSFASGDRDMASATQTMNKLATSTVYMNGTTDYIELYIQHNSGAAINTSVAARFASFLEARFLGRVTNP